MNAIWCAFVELIAFFWNPLIEIFNFILGMVLDPIGFVLWLIGQLLIIVSNVLPSTPQELTLQHAVNQIGETTNLGTSLIAEIIGSASQILAIVAVIKIYKLLPGKFT